jgi:alkylhydroperoxidase family enzyme
MLCVVHAATLLITPRAGSVLTAAARGMRRAAALGDGEASAAAAQRTSIVGLRAARQRGSASCLDGWGVAAARAPSVVEV